LSIRLQLCRGEKDAEGTAERKVSKRTGETQKRGHAELDSIKGAPSPNVSFLSKDLRKGTELARTRSWRKRLERGKARMENNAVSEPRSVSKTEGRKRKSAPSGLRSIRKCLMIGD